MHAAPTPAPLTIFVADDDPVVLESLTAMLQARRYAVEGFSSGQALLDRAEGATADCLLLDVNMPRMSGLEVVQALRRRGPVPPVILMTGAATRAITAQAKAMGLELLEKPVPPVTLVSAIEQIAGARGARSV